MKKIISLILVSVLLVSFVACGKETETLSTEENSPITMFIALGNNEDYYTAFKENIKQDLGIDVEFVYQLNGDTSDYVKQMFSNNDLPADLIFTSSKTEDELLENTCVDLLSRTSVASLFTPSIVAECTTDEGAIYQLPVSSKLIGITYNETLMNEMGWTVPETFDDMVSLKAKCDEAGVKFAVSDGAATGHGFNWLFHLMGSQWLSTPEGTTWFENYREGKATIDEFKEKCEYFKRWKEAGLFGSFRTVDWNGNVEFSQTRALFLYRITNDTNGYEGKLYDEDGNETEIRVNDTYKAMPWISEDGSNNCFTYYHNSWVHMNKDLEKEENSEKLKNAIKVIEYMVGEKMSDVVSETAKDAYVAVNNFEMDEDRIYGNYADSIVNGFVQPWYYNYFDADSIVITGETINNYIDDKGDFDTIFTTLDKCTQNYLNAETVTIADFPDGLDFEETAELVAVCGAEALDNTLEENGREERTEVSLVPYTPGANLMQPFKGVAVSNSIVYKGKLDLAYRNCILPPKVTRPVGILMTGAEIKEITENKFDPSDRVVDAETGETEFDIENYGPYPYVCLVKGGGELEDEKEYLVAVDELAITKAQYESFAKAGKVLTDLENTHTYEEGFRSYAEKNPTITADMLTLK